MEGLVPQPPGGPLVGPAQPPVHLPHQGDVLIPQGVRDRAPVPVLGPGRLCPWRRPPLLPLCLQRRCRAPPPPPAKAIRAGCALGAGGACWCRGRGGLGGDLLAGVGVDVVEVVALVVVVVGVMRRHLLDAGGDAPQRLHVRLRGRPAPRSPPFDPPSPPGSHAPSRLSLGARGALALALGPPSGPPPVPWDPLPVTHALACPLAHRPSLRSLHPGALPAPLRTLPVPRPLPGPLP